MKKELFKNSTNPVKAFGRLLMILFVTGALYLLFQDVVNPEAMSYGNAFVYFATLYAVSFPFQYFLEVLKAKHLHLENGIGSYLYSWKIELLIWLLFALLMPFTGDLGA
ncbi:hypothetical protein EDL98_11445 [Ornithobacterium rhinotracheale]|uniref:hypothetical protein n=1 Tax=Ornithobacterium rhinotracheale TaxID=28251 RepID=UPI00129CA1CB|nr:hypothetical protein [Ornithobacterium rhinotracheale]MRJ11676.1 hypothetical protein [Ornithobacterium rhinotracheale]